MNKRAYFDDKWKNKEFFHIKYSTDNNYLFSIISSPKFI